MAGSTKGMSFHDVVLIVGERFCDSAREELISGLSAADQPTLSSLVSIRLQAVYGERHAQVLEEYGRFSAHNDLTTTHKLFLRFASPGTILNAAYPRHGQLGRGDSGTST